MKKHIFFQIENTLSIDDLLYKGLTGYAIESFSGDAVATLWLFLVDGSILRIRSFVTTIAKDSWDEVGSLEFRLFSQKDFPSKNDSLPIKVILPSTWSNIIKIDHLMYCDDDVIVESGLSIKNNDGSELLILAAALPETIAIAAPFYFGKFQPEFEITDYQTKER